MWTWTKLPRSAEWIVTVLDPIRMTMSVLGPARTCVFLLSSIPTFLQRPYSVPLGIPNSVAAFCTAMPPLMASSAVLRSSWTREVRVRGSQ